MAHVSKLRWRRVQATRHEGLRQGSAGWPEGRDIDTGNAPIRMAEMTDLQETTTVLLRDLTQGDTSAVNRLLPLVYEDLRGIASAMMRRERADHTLDPTSVVHEAYLRLVDQTRANWKDRAHFLAVAAEAIRRVLIDHARRRRTQKRGGDWSRITLSDAAVLPGGETVDLLELDRILNKLSGLHARQAEVVKLKFFAGLKNEEMAHVLGVSRSTISDDWTVARTWLAAELQD